MLCGSWPKATLGSGRKSAAQPSLSGAQLRPPSADFEHAADRDREVQMLQVAGIDQYRMQQLATRRAGAGRPLRPHRVIVEPGHGFPGLTAVRRMEQSRGRAAGVPAPRFRRMARCKPEDRIHGASLLALSRLAKRRRLLRFAPAAATVARAEDRRSEMPRPGRHQQHLRLARVLDDVVNDMPEELRAGELSRCVAAHPRAARTPPCACRSRSSCVLRRYFMVGMTNCGASCPLVGQREVTVLSLV